MSHHNHDGHHSHDHDHDHDDQVFVVTDENGAEHEMVMVYTFETQGQAYAVLLDRNDPEADGVIFRIEEEDDDAYLASIESDEEWDRVVEIYNEIVARETTD
jgi:uncharacterized protein YrzB (UPF0473 family)